MTQNHEGSLTSTFVTFYKDAVKVLIHPKAFYESMEAEKDQGAIYTFLILSALLYSVAASFFARDQQLVLLLSFFLHGSILPFILATMLYLMMLFLNARIGYGRALAITAYANTALLFAWIPGMAPFAEIFRYYLMGVGIANVTGLSGWKSFFVLLGMGIMLLVVIYALQTLIAR
jgi:hypothetical protein